MSSRKKDFREEDKIKCLLWCARHCCLCGKSCGVGIEIAHVDPNGSCDIDNVIPLCFDCHADIGHYNDKHPRGQKFRARELKARREQIYEEHTKHLVPSLLYQVMLLDREKCKAGFNIHHMGGTYPVQARVIVSLAQGIRRYGSPTTVGHYDGKYLWNLNPGFGVAGYFSVPKNVFRNLDEPLKASIEVTVLDIYKREHKLLPIGYIHRLGDNDEWYLEASEEELGTHAVITSNVKEEKSAKKLSNKKRTTAISKKT